MSSTNSSLCAFMSGGTVKSAEIFAAHIDAVNSVSACTARNSRRIPGVVRALGAFAITLAASWTPT